MFALRRIVQLPAGSGLLVLCPTGRAGGIGGTSLALCRLPMQALPANTGVPQSFRTLRPGTVRLTRSAETPGFLHPCPLGRVSDRSDVSASSIPRISLHINGLPPLSSRTGLLARRTIVSLQRRPYFVHRRRCVPRLEAKSWLLRPIPNRQNRAHSPSASYGGTG